MTRIRWNLTQALESLKNLYFHLFLLCKVFNVWPKNSMEVIFHNTEKWCKIWEKTDLRCGKWLEKYGKFSPEHFKMSKLGLWWDPLIQSRKSMSLKFTEELCVMTMKNNAKFEEELTCRFKISMRNLTNFEPSTWMSQKFSLWGTPFEQIICLSQKSTEEVSFMTMEWDTKFAEELTCHFKIDIRNLTNFDLSTRKSQKFSL